MCLLLQFSDIFLVCLWVGRVAGFSQIKFVNLFLSSDWKYCIKKTILNDSWSEGGGGLSRVLYVIIWQCEKEKNK